MDKISLINLDSEDDKSDGGFRSMKINDKQVATYSINESECKMNRWVWTI